MSPNNAVSGHSKPATKGRMKTSHFEGSIASWAAKAANDRDERTQRELAAFDCSFVRQGLVAPTYCPRVGDQPRDGGPVSSTGPTNPANLPGTRNICIHGIDMSFNITWITCWIVFCTTPRPSPLPAGATGRKTMLPLLEKTTKLRRKSPNSSNLLRPAPICAP